MFRVAEWKIESILKIEQVQNKLPVPNPCAFIRNLDILMNFEIWQKKKFNFSKFRTIHTEIFLKFIYFIIKDFLISEN